MTRYNRSSSSSTPFFIFLIIIIAAVVYLTKHYLPARNNLSNEVSNKADIENIVKETIKNSPEIIIAALENYEANKQKEMESKSKAVISEKKSDLENSISPSNNNKDTDVTVIEFFDYNCGYCKRASSALAKIASEDKKVKIIYKEFPILGDSSREAAKIALAINLIAPHKYSEFHDKLMSKPSLNDAVILQIIEQIGIDKNKIDAMKNDPKINEELDRNKELANKLNIQGTPAFVINNDFIPGALSEEGFKDKIKAVRSK